MKRNNDFIVGLTVLFGVVAIIAATLWVKQADIRDRNERVTARFRDVGNVRVGAAVVLRGVRAALNAEDEYGSYIAFGISALLGLQALINLSVAMAILPTKGLTLPFLSYGGSSLLVSCAATGILLNISRPRLPASSAERAAPPSARADAAATIPVPSTWAAVRAASALTSAVAAT